MIDTSETTAMTQQPLADWPDPLPQVGAVLYLDSEIGPNPPDYTGGKHWKLTGSCVLIAPDRILTIGHTLAARSEALPDGHYAAFFPYLGLVPIVPIDENAPVWLEWEPNQTKGDNLAVARLQEPVNHWLPLQPFYERGWKNRLDHALVCGYGDWRKGGLPVGDFEGLQQQHPVALGSQQSVAKLDLRWSSRKNEGLAASRGNSGGPVLWSEDHRVVGINREVDGDRQLSSWVTRERMAWLKPVSLLAGPGQVSAPRKQEWKLLTLTPEKEATAEFPVPEEAKLVRATLNASSGLRLRMEMTPTVGEPKTSTGRFLCRESELPEGTQKVVIRVGRAPRSPYLDGQQVLAQLCVLFV